MDDRRQSNYRLRMTLIAFALSILFAVLTVPYAFAQSSVTTNEVNAVAKGLYCPVCESEPLDTCQTQACQDWRDEIRVQLEDGATEADIHNNFRARYGDRVLAQPPADGFNLVLWLGLPLFVILGGVGFGRYLRTIRQIPPASQPNAATTNHKSQSDEYIQRIEEELAQKP